MEIKMIGNWAAHAANRGVAMVASLLMRSAIKSLLGIDERSLLAAGLSRADLVESLATPFTADPTELLVSRSDTVGLRRGDRRMKRARRRRGVAPAAQVASRAHRFFKKI
jgi:hypothetical protein